MMKVYGALVCGSIFLSFSSASAVTPDSKSLTPSDASISVKSRPVDHPVLLASAEITGSESSTPGAYLQTIGSTLQAASTTPSPQPATHTLLLAGLIAVLYVALRRRQQP